MNESAPAVVSAETSLKEENLVFYNPRKAPFRIYGLYAPENGEAFRRIPADVAQATSAGVASHAVHTAGGRVRFSTDSPYIAIKAVMPSITHFAHMPLTGTSGFDLYADGEDGSRYCGTFQPNVNMTDGYESILRFKNRKMRNITINFPSYNPLTEIYIGLSADAQVGEGAKYLSELPVIYYGSSITQGACASRPGLSYENFITRKYNLDYINLGFSGNGKAELPIVNYMAKIPMLAFVSDYDHNAPSVAYLRDTHRRMYEIIREANPDVPYLMVSRPDFLLNRDAAIERRDVILDTFRFARENGDRNVFCIDGEGLYHGPYEDACSVDNTHPNDIGMMFMGEKIGRMLERALRGKHLFAADGQ